MRISIKRNRLLRLTMNAYLSSAKLLLFCLVEILVQGQFMLHTGHLSLFSLSLQTFLNSLFVLVPFSSLSPFVFSLLVSTTLVSKLSQVQSINQLISLHLQSRSPYETKIKEWKIKRTVQRFDIYQHRMCNI